jgi:glutamate synthase domain-containing protein 1
MVNPYLMGSTLLAAMDDGLENSLDPGEPEERNIYEAIAEGKDVKKLPISLGEALDKLAEDEEVQRGGLGACRPLITRNFGRRIQMCGIAGLIHKDKSSAVGAEMTAMLQALKHRGPDSTGYAVYGDPTKGDYVMRLKVAEAEDMARGRGIHQVLKGRIETVEEILNEHGAEVKSKDQVTGYALRYVISHSGNTGDLAQHIEETEGVEILSLGNGLELIKDLGDASVVSQQYGLNDFQGTHGIGHTRMATESDVDIKSVHPYWAFPYNDVSVVHNGQITNYWIMRREMERKGHRFMSNCDSELLAVYTAHNLANGIALEESLRKSIDEIDGVFTYLVATKDQLGMAKDTIAAKPLVLYESDDLIAMASEEVAIRAILPENVNERSKLTRVQRLILTQPMRFKAPRRAALI